MKTLLSSVWSVAVVSILAACGGSDTSPAAGAGGNDSGGGGGGDDSGGGGGVDSGGGGGVDAADAGGGSDTGSGGDSGTVACTGMKFCDDFEGYDGAVANGAKLGPWTASVGGTGTVVMVDTTKPHAGAKSLHITVPTGAAAHGTLNQKAAGGLVPQNDLFGRAMVFYSDAGGNGLALGVHSWLFNAAGNSDAGAGNVTMNMGGGGAKLQLNYHPPAPLPEQSMQGGAMTAGAWHCVQWQYDGSGSPVKNEARVWVDGALAVDVPVTKGWNFATPWSTFDFGFTHYQTLANPVDIYLDDFALNDAMIACP